MQKLASLAPPVTIASASAPAPEASMFAASSARALSPSAAARDAQSDEYSDTSALTMRSEVHVVTGTPNMQVFVRVRPSKMSAGAKVLTSEPKSNGDDEGSHVLLSDGSRFSFNRVFEGQTNEAIYRQVGEPLLRSTLEGLNGTLIAYGQTGTGKTFTLSGERIGSQDEGLMPRMLRQLFESSTSHTAGRAKSSHSEGTEAKALMDAAETSEASSDETEVGEDEEEYDDTTVSNCGPLRMQSALPSEVAPSSRIEISLQYVQVYLDRIYDLLADDENADTALPLREDPSSGVHVEGVTNALVGTIEDGWRLLHKGAARLHISSTHMNRHSSRSHAVAIFTVSHHSIVDPNLLHRRQPHQQRPRPHVSRGQAGPPPLLPDPLTVGQSRAEPAAPILNGQSSRSRGAGTGHDQSSVHLLCRSRLTVCDLAGSERVARTGSAGATLEEAKKINASLHALGNVISALARESRAQHVEMGPSEDRQTRQQAFRGSMSSRTPNHVPFRNSTLTRLLQESLGGNCVTSILITVSSAAIDLAETRSSLQFGQRAARVRNQPTLHGPLVDAALSTAVCETEDGTWGMHQAPQHVVSDIFVAELSHAESTIDELRAHVGASSVDREQLQERVTLLSMELEETRRLGEVFKMAHEDAQRGLDASESRLGASVRETERRMEALRDAAVTEAVGEAVASERASRQAELGRVQQQLERMTHERMAMAAAAKEAERRIGDLALALQQSEQRRVEAEAQLRLLQELAPLPPPLPPPPPPMPVPSVSNGDEQEVRDSESDEMGGNSSGSPCPEVRAATIRAQEERKQTYLVHLTDRLVKAHSATLEAREKRRNAGPQIGSRAPSE